MKFYEHKKRPLVETAGHVIAWLTPRHPCIEVPRGMLTEATEMDVTVWRQRFGLTVAEVEEACVHTLTEVPEERAPKTF